MERLTETYDDGSFGLANDLPCGENSYDFKDLLINRLGEYEDAEENGLLVRLPCKVGEIVYIVIPPISSPPVNGWVYKAKIYDACTSGFFASDVANYDLENDYTAYDEIGKTVFLTQAEAEAKLRGMEGGNEI